MNKTFLRHTVPGLLVLTGKHHKTYVHVATHDMHTGQRANKSGWRWFIRLSRNTDRQKHMTNELRRQVQVYLEPATEGW